MSIQKDGETLVKAGHTSVVECDDWLVKLEVAGLSPAGDLVTLQITLSRNEIERAIIPAMTKGAKP